MNTVENIRAALADARNRPWIGAGPSFGAPHPAYLNSVVEDVDHDDAATICRDTETGDARYIAACNPTAMAEVLAHIDRQAAEIAGLQLLHQEDVSEIAADHLAELQAYELTVANLREQLAQQAPQVPMTLDSVVDLVGECGLDWHKGFEPLFDGDPTNRFAVLVEAVEDHHNIKEQP